MFRNLLINACKAVIIITAIVVICAVLAAIFFPRQASASGNLTVQGDVIKPEDDKSYLTSDINVFLEASNNLGFGLNTTITEKDYLKVKPFVSVAVADGLRLVGGYSSESTSYSFVHGGFEYFHAFSKVDTAFFSACYFFGLEGGTEDFVDSFLELKHNFGNKFALALEVVYDRWPETKSNWLLIGPVLHYKINEKMDLFARIAGESCIDEWTSVDYRIGVNYSF